MSIKIQKIFFPSTHTSLDLWLPGPCPGGPGRADKQTVGPSDRQTDKNSLFILEDKVSLEALPKKRFSCHFSAHNFFQKLSSFLHIFFFLLTQSDVRLCIACLELAFVVVLIHLDLLFAWNKFNLIK